MIMKKEVRVQSVRFLDNVNFVARVNYRDYIGTYYLVGKYITVDACYEVNSTKQTTFRIKIAISYKLEELLNNLKNKAMRTETVFESQIRRCIKLFAGEIKTACRETVTIDCINVDVENGYIVLSAKTEKHTYYQELEKFDSSGWVNMNFFVDGVWAH